jgi:hypothetical protein
MVTGELPFKGDDPLALLIAIANDPPVPPWEINPALPQVLSELILSLLAKDRRYRPASAKAVIDALESVEPEPESIGPTEDTDPLLQTAEWPQSQETIVIPRVQQPRCRKSWLAVGLCIAGFLLALAAGWLLLAKNKVPACLDELRLKDVPAPLLRAAGHGDPNKAPEGLVAVWSVAMPGTPVTALDFSHDGKLLACGTPQGRVRLLAVPTGQRVGLFQAHARMIQQIAFHPDGEILATSANDGQVRLWSIDGLERTESFPAADGDSRPLAFSFDGKILATGSRGKNGGCLQLHSMMPGTPTPIPLRDSQFGVSALAFSSAGLLAAGDADRKTVRFWDSSTGTALYSVSPEPGETASSLAFSPDGTQLAGTFVSTHIVRIWSAATGEQLRLLECTPKLHNGRSRQQVAIGPDNRTLAAVTSAGVIRLRDLSTDKPAKTIRVSPAVSQVNQIAFSPDGRHLATANNNGTVYILRLGDSSKQE